MTRNVMAIVCTFMFVLCSCGDKISGGFWLRFKLNYLKWNVSDQGPQGGHLALYWESVTPNTFEVKEIFDLAKQNGWQFTDSIKMQIDALKTWYYNEIPIFPLSYTGFSSTVTSNNSEYRYFPRWINEGLTVYKFKTGWLAYEQGTNEFIDINGFVVLNSNGTKLSIYHLWGE